ncbi:MAG TPA: DUF3772 domain-containing protein [Variovorax sp.]|nr:DUF3772 domain-containing protein [Variovorax sp.]
MSWITRYALALLTALLLCGTSLAQSTAGPGASAEVTVASMRALLERLPESADTEEDVQRLNELTSEITTQAERFVAQRTTQLADLNARLGELGPAPTAEGSTEATDITRQRSSLTRERNAVDADIRLARLLAVNAQQRRSEVLAERRAVFEARLLERSDSPLSTAFWHKAAAQWQVDQARLRELNAEIQQGLATALSGTALPRIMLGCLAALAIIIAGIWLAEAGLTRLAARTFPVGRLRRSLLALLTVLGYILIVGLAASVAWESLEDGGNWTTQSRRLAESVVRLCMFLAFVVGLGRALLANQRSSWRLPPITDAMASRLAPLPWLMAFVATVVWLPSALGEVTGEPLNGVLSSFVPTCVYLLAALAGLYLLRPSKPAAAAGAPSPDPAAERPMWVGLFIGLVAVLMVAQVILMALGYLALAQVLAAQATWAGIVIVAAYLLFKFADDLWMALLSSRSNSGQRLQKALGVAPHVLDQLAVLLSGVSRVAVFFYMLVAFVAPLGSSPGQLLQRSGKFGTGLKVGEFEIVPGAILSALSVLVVGLVVLRLLKRWLENTYLPNTQLETGMRSSLTTLLGYAGVIMVVAFTLSALGIGVNRIAWVASALSVGIGFGLQAIVQNFISGLILLAERPVKVGDWVVLGTSEGDVRRINVRATEIQLGDRSTLIVPNSEFITKTVRNMTLANAEGRVLIRLPMPLSTHAQQVRDLMLAACAEHESVLETPLPSVTLEGIENGLLIFQAIAYVPSPRMAGGVRSDLLFTILERLQAAQVPMAAYVPPPVPAAPVPAGPFSA